MIFINNISYKNWRFEQQDAPKFERYEKLDFIKIKDLCVSKDIIKTKRQPSEWEKRFANKATDRGLISKIYKQIMQLKSKKTNNPV